LLRALNPHEKCLSGDYRNFQRRQSAVAAHRLREGFDAELRRSTARKVPRGPCADALCCECARSASVPQISYLGLLRISLSFGKLQEQSPVRFSAVSQGV
jgi:hypothetical protein